MKKLILLICFIVIASFVFSQNKPKRAPPKKPAQSEMDKMMEEAMKGMSPEEKAEMKKMMDSMGVKIPTIKPIQKQTNGVTNNQLKNLYDDEASIVPAKDNVRISSIAKLPLTATSIPAFIAESHNFINQRLNPSAREMADKIFTELKTKYGSTAETGNNAAALWIQGKTQIALALMAKTCVANPSNYDNLSNYAAMLSMCGAEQLAIPLLNYLNARFPKNSTILNNLGQAWFGLGDIAKADKYLDTVIRIYAWQR
jgi:tetratricopeptide (TPR) repeat protein